MQLCYPAILILLWPALVTCEGDMTPLEMEHMEKDSVKLVKMIKGNDNIIISVPHGGYLSPARMTQREKGCLVDEKCVYRIGCEPKSKKCKIVPRRDINAFEIGEALVKRLQEKGRKPHVVYMLLHRRFIDPNRPPEEACQGMKKCLAVYNVFHNFIQNARRKVNGPGLYIDVHTIRHKANWTELGYRISKQALNESGPLREQASSINQLVKRTGLSLEELVRGPRSMGQRLSAKGYQVIPSPRHPRPGLQGYARGGYNTLMYGSLNGGCIDGVQVEGSLSIRLGGKAAGQEFGRQVADVILDFMKDFGYDERSTICDGNLSGRPAVWLVTIASGWLLWLHARAT